MTTQTSGERSHPHAAAGPRSPGGLGIRPCVSCLWGEGGRRRARLTAVSCGNQGIINTVSLLRLPPPPPGLENKQEAQGRGRGAAGGRKGRPSRGAAGDTGTCAGTRGRTRTAAAAGAVPTLVDRFLSLWSSVTLGFLICSMGIISVLTAPK